jgi:16S rRNA (cytosine1402-N4)-methyltransferase
MTLVDVSTWTHIPVMFEEVIREVEPVFSRGMVTLFDGTFGRGGHYRCLKQAYGEKLSRVVAFDQDQEAIGFAKEYFSEDISSSRLILHHKNFSEVDTLPDLRFDVMLLDLGVSSPQLDTAERGFSFLGDGPLDMRMNKDNPVTAAEIINDWTEKDLIEIFQRYGEIPSPYRVVRAIVHDRKWNQFRTTRELASLIERVEGWRKKGFHPATLYFQALRMVVNRELESLELFLQKAPAHLNPDGLLLIISFHSLEDRLVKWFYRDHPALGVMSVYKKVLTPTEEEMKRNPRSRSAKMRVFRRSSS